MHPAVAVIAPGAMGAAIAARLTQSGIAVCTHLAGRSAASAKRAQEAGMIPVESERELVARAEIMLSIVPPGAALALAERFGPALAGASRKPVFVDCNAVNPATMARLAECLAPTGADLVDGGIIGGPPKPGTPGPRLYVSGAGAERLEALRPYGLDVRRLEGPVGAASALKMSYAGITKGLTAIGAVMALGAAAGGSSAALAQELTASQPALAAYLRRSLPDMYGKAYRWIAEMDEIAGFVGGDGAIYQAFARLYERLAADATGERHEIAALDAFLARLAM